MLQTFEARLKGNQLEWVNEIPKQAIENALLSEKALAKDWNKPEEDEAWSHLQSIKQQN
jgi:hypothetical protein